MVTAVYLPALLLSFCNGLLVPTLPLFASDLGISFGLVGTVLAAEAIGTLLADIPAGLLLKRFGDKTVMIVGIALVAASVLMLVPARGVVEVVALRLAAGVGQALWGISRHAFLAQATRSGRRGRAISAFGGVSRAGALLGPAAGGAVAALFGLRAPFVVYGAVALAAVMIVALAVPSGGRGVQGVGEQPSPDFRALRGFVGVLTAAGLAQLMAQMLRAGRRVLIPLYASHVLGLDVGAVGLVLSASAFADMSLFYPAGMLMDRFGRKFAIVPSFVLQAFGMALVPLAHSFVALLGLALLLGLGNGLSAGTMMTVGADLAPPEALGEFLGVWRLIGDGGSSGGPLLVGVVAEALDLGLASIAVAVVGLGAAAMFAFRVPETLRRT